MEASMGKHTNVDDAERVASSTYAGKLAILFVVCLIIIAVAIL